MYVINGGGWGICILLLTSFKGRVEKIQRENAGKSIFSTSILIVMVVGWIDGVFKYLGTLSPSLYYYEGLLLLRRILSS